jgi:putative ABC transport system permease protein
MIGVGVATAMMISALAIGHGYEQSLARNIDAMGYQVLVTGKGCPHEAATLILRGGSIPMYIDERVHRHIAADPDVSDTTRFFMQSLPGDAPGSFQLYTGIDDHFLELKPHVTFQRGEWFDSDASEQAILGYNVAEFKRLDVGDDVVVFNRRLSVCGILDKLGTQDDGTIFMPLLTAQQMFDKRDRLTGVGVRLTDMNNAAAFIDRVYQLPGTQVITMSQVQRTILNVLNSVRTLLLTITAIGLIVACLGVLNASLMSVQEQRAEMGVSRALGCPGGDLFKLVWAETLLLSVGGAALGVALTLLLREVVERYVHQAISFVPSGQVVTITPSIAVGSCATIVALSLIGGIYPAWRASVASPLASIRGAA